MQGRGSRPISFLQDVKRDITAKAIMFGDEAQLGPILLLSPLLLFPRSSPPPSPPPRSFPWPFNHLLPTLNTNTRKPVITERLSATRFPREARIPLLYSIESNCTPVLEPGLKHGMMDRYKHDQEVYFRGLIYYNSSYYYY